MLESGIFISRGVLRMLKLLPRPGVNLGSASYRIGLTFLRPRTGHKETDFEIAEEAA